MIKRFIHLFSAGLIALAMIACDTALGSMINMKGPVVTITGPTVAPEATSTIISVEIAFDLTGLASSEDDITRMEVVIDYYDSKTNTTNRLGREWRFEGGIWKYKADGYLSWKTYEQGDYNSIENMDTSKLLSPGWQVHSTRISNTVNWNLPILLHDMDSGDYFITVSAWDSAGHHDANSIQRLKVYYVNTEPQLNVSTPVLNPGKMTYDMRNPDVPDVFSTWIYDPIGRPEDTYLNINNWVTEPFDFRWSINDEAAYPYQYLKIEFTNKHQLDDFTNKELYYVFESSQSIPRSGILTDGITPFGYEKAGPAIQGIKPRNLDTYLPLGTELVRDKPTYVQVVSTLHDGSGNAATRRSKGFFAYLPDADKPWVDIKFANIWAEPDKTPSITIVEKYLQKQLPNTLNVAYSKSELKKISWKLYKLNDDLSIISFGDGSLNSPFKGGEDFAPNKRKANWTFTSLSEFGEGPFKIVVTVEDTAGRTGEYTAYFTVESNATPTVKEFNPDLESTITYFGTTQGIFDIGGVAQVENGSTIDRITVVWIRPHSDPEVSAERQLRYTDRNYANWDKAVNSSGYWEDPSTRDSRVWELSPAFFWQDSSTLNNLQVEYIFNKSLNIFDDLDIGPGKNQFGSQVFLVRVLSNKAQGKTLSSVRSFTTTGDNEAPEVKITHVRVTKASSAQDFEPPFTGNSRLPTLMAGDKLSLRGTWNDNSLVAWKALSSEKLKSLFADFEVTWNWNNGTWAEPKAGEVQMPNCVFDTNGTWSTGDLVFAENNLNSSVYVQASITDLNNNRGRVGGNGEGEQIEIQIDIPFLSRISSSASDNYYGVNKETNPLEKGSHYIDISLEFNKNLKFFNTSLSTPSGKIPYLKLNNGGRAYYYSGNGDSVFTFRYFVDGDRSSLGYASNQIDADTLADRGGDSTPGTPPGRLNVEEIVYGDYPLQEWKSVDIDTVLTIENQLFDPNYSSSLAGSKNIIIDKDAPTISNIVTSASSAKSHGVGSIIYITVLFNKTISIPKNTQPGDFWLNLRGGNLATNSAKAMYANVAGASSISFQYEVLAGHDTSEYSQNLNILNIESMDLNGVIISDLAENVLATNPYIVLPNSGTLYKSSAQSQAANLVIDTKAPQIPGVTIVNPVTSNRYYEYKKFNITGIESTQSTVEYSLNYDGNPSTATWVTVQSTPLGSATNNFYINGIDLNINGTYNLVVRQSDNATTPNVSQPSLPVTVVIDSGAILSRVGSSTPDGIYGYKASTKQEIKINLVFRIPVYLNNPTTAAIDSASVLLNIVSSDGDCLDRQAKLKGVYQPDPTTLSFTYELSDGDMTKNTLDVTEINFGSLRLYDGDNGSATFLNDFVKFDRAGNTNHQFSKQKNITLLSGYPRVSENKEIGTALNSTHDLAFYAENDDYVLDLRFNRDIYRGDTSEPVVFKQIKSDYRIPTVLSVLQWEKLFMDRTDLASYITIPGSWTPPSGYTNSKKDYWRWVGNQLYQQGSNGASVGESNTLVSDTSVKYVLRYDINPLTPTTPISTNVSGYDLTVGGITDILREAEAVKIDIHDQDVNIISDGVDGPPRILRVRLSGDNKLAVKGAKYQWIFPKGFVKDVLENYNGNGTAIVGNDLSLTSGDSESSNDDNNVRVLKTPGAEAPVIRVNKGDDMETITGSGNNRQAIQPLTSSVRIDCRMPGSTLTYRTRQTTDNVGRLVMRDKPADYSGEGISATSNRLPNLGSQKLGDYASYNDVAGRPQSGNSQSIMQGGYNLWTPMAAWPSGFDPYSNAFTIGDNNYNTGGMIIHVQARANAGGITVDSYEAAYRSVLVYQNAVLNSNINTSNADDNNRTNLGGSFNNVAAFDNPARSRLWVRGGDNTSGVTSIPDFPISRDRSLWKKSRLMTPINASVFTSLSQAQTEIITNSNIPTTYESHGRYLWFWVTWRINVNAYPDFFAGELPLSDTALQAPVNSKDFYYGFMRAKEHYPVIPGRTTVAETRVTGDYVDGGHGIVAMGAANTVPERTDW